MVCAEVNIEFVFSLVQRRPPAAKLSVCVCVCITRNQKRKWTGFLGGRQISMQTQQTKTQQQKREHTVSSMQWYRWTCISDWEIERRRDCMLFRLYDNRTHTAQAVRRERKSEDNDCDVICQQDWIFRADGYQHMPKAHTIHFIDIGIWCDSSKKHGDWNIVYQRSIMSPFSKQNSQMFDLSEK